jgi:hypothetical protein
MVRDGASDSTTASSGTRPLPYNALCLLLLLRSSRACPQICSHHHRPPLVLYPISSDYSQDSPSGSSRTLCSDHCTVVLSNAFLPALVRGDCDLGGIWSHDMVVRIWPKLLHILEFTVISIDWNGVNNPRLPW